MEQLVPIYTPWYRRETMSEECHVQEYNSVDLAYINHSLKEHEDVYHWSSSLRISHNLFFTHCT